MILFRIAAPFFIIIVATSFLVEDKLIKSIVISCCVIPLFVTMVFRRQILLWWYAKNPPLVEEQMRNLLQHQFPYYKNLSIEYKKRFEQRLAVFMLHKAFEKKGLETLPEEVKGLLCAQGVQLTFGLEEYLLPNFDILVFYPTGFATPQLPKIHTSEIYEEGDNSSMIFAADSLVEGMSNQAVAFNIGMYEMAEVLRILKNIEDYEQYQTPQNIQRLGIVRGAPYVNLLRNTGKETLNFFSLSVEHFFYNPVKFKELLPQLFDYLRQTLNQNPINTLTPINDHSLNIRKVDTA